MVFKKIGKGIKKFEAWKEKGRKKVIKRAARNTEKIESQIKEQKAVTKLARLRAQEAKARRSAGGSGGFMGGLENFQKNMAGYDPMGPMNIGGGKKKGKKKRNDFSLF